MIGFTPGARDDSEFQAKRPARIAILTSEMAINRMAIMIWDAAARSPSYTAAMLGLYDQIAAAERLIRTGWKGEPRLGVVLGTGLGALAQDIEAAVRIPYADLPHFPQSTVVGHAGELVCGTFAGKSVVAMAGRFHAYE